jgi:hypothetical protein
VSAAPVAAQTASVGSIEFSASVRPPEAQPEPVRGVTFYLLSRSLADIRKEVESTSGFVDLDHFIAQLGISPELKGWMKTHHRVDLAGADFVKELTPDDIITVPEFLNAYKVQNGAALHAVIPEPKFKKDEEQKNPEKYKAHLDEYRQALRQFIARNLDTLQGLDADLRDANPMPRWLGLQSEQQRQLERRVLQVAQTRYLVATAVTDLNGRSGFENLPPRDYWISNLDAAALAGDLHLHWDFSVTVSPGKTAPVELSNLNSVESSQPAN